MRRSLQLVNTSAGFVDNALECLLQEWDVIFAVYCIPGVTFVVAVAFAWLEAERGADVQPRYHL